MPEPLSRLPIDARPPPWLRRHHLLWIASTNHAAVAAEFPDPALRNTVLHWLAAGRPVVVCQQSNGHARVGSQARVAVGIPLPLAQGKQRVVLSVAPEWVAHSAPPPLLRDVILRIPGPRRVVLMRLDWSE